MASSPLGCLEACKRHSPFPKGEGSPGEPWKWNREVGKFTSFKLNASSARSRLRQNKITPTGFCSLFVKTARWYILDYFPESDILRAGRGQNLKYVWVCVRCVVACMYLGTDEKEEEDKSTRNSSPKPIPLTHELWGAFVKQRKAEGLPTNDMGLSFLSHDITKQNRKISKCQNVIHLSRQFLSYKRPCLVQWYENYLFYKFKQSCRVCLKMVHL